MVRKSHTWVVMEDNVEEVLVSPSDVVLILLMKWMQEILPRKATGDHTVLKYQQKRSVFFPKNTSSKQKHIYILKVLRAAKLSCEGRSLCCKRGNQKASITAHSELSACDTSSKGGNHSSLQHRADGSVGKRDLTLNSVLRILVRFISMTPELTPVTP